MCKPAPHPRPVCTQTCPLPDRPAALPRTWAQMVLISCCLSGDAWISLCTWEDPVPWLPRELLPRKGTSTIRPSSWLHDPFKQNVLCVELNFSMPNSPLSAEANTYLPPVHPPRPVSLLFHPPVDPWNVSLCLLLAAVHFSSVPQSCLRPMNCSTPGFPVHHQLPELAQIHVHQVGDAIQPSHPVSHLKFK